MKLTYSSEERAWRDELRAFLASELPDQIRCNLEYCQDEGIWPGALAFSRKVAAKGWLALTWPPKYGGLGRPASDRRIMAEEFTYHEAPLVGPTGWGFVAGALLQDGSDEQKERFLPAIGRLETFIVEGFSEPDSGSDLASLKTRAVRDGNTWVINGQKTFTTWAERADAIIVLARTDPKSQRHRGLSLFYVPLDAKGVSVSPLYNIGGGRQNHTFLDDVMVDDDMRVGRLNEAWPLVMGTFYGGGGGGHLVPAVEHQKRMDAIVDYCASAQRRGKALGEDPAIQDKLAELALIVTTGRLLTLDAAGAVAHGSQPKYAGALNPVVTKENTPRFAELCNEILGPLGQLAAGSPLAPVGGRFEEWYRWSFRTHAGGTPQVKRMVLATRGLGLPR